MTENQASDRMLFTFTVSTLCASLCMSVIGLYADWPALVAQLDVLNGDQDVAGSTPAGSATFFRGD